MTLGIYCAGGHGRDVLNLAQQIGEFDQYVFIDDASTKPTVNGVRVFTYSDFTIAYTPNDVKLVIAAGENTVRKKLSDKVLADNYSLTTLVHPSTYVPGSCNLGNGVVVLENTRIGPNTRLGDGVYLHVNSVMSHDVELKAFSAVSLNCMIGGNVTIGESTYIGMGAVVRNGVTIEDHCIIGMGSVVLKDIPSYSLAYGNPARVIRKLTSASKVF